MHITKLFASTFETVFIHVLNVCPETAFKAGLYNKDCSAESTTFESENFD